MSRKELELGWDYLWDILDYNANTGIFINKIDRGKGTYAKAGDIAGYTNSAGYVVITIGGNKYYAHRLAWFYELARWPISKLDHIDRCRSNNSLANLREVTDSENCQNSSPHSGASSLYKGVHFDSRKGKWKSQIRLNYKAIYLGQFDDEIEAAKAYNLAAHKLHGKFAVLNKV